MFEPVAKAEERDEQYFCNASGSDGRGLLTDEGFVVLKGSIGRRDHGQSIKGKAAERFRLKLVESGVLREEGETVVFEKDYLFGSPSMAGVMLLGRSANGWVTWKTKDGRTLDEVKRQGVTP